jgi:ribose transport system ATP-binding protein
VLLKAEHITKRFRSITALEDVSVEVRRNEIVGLLGQNGAGKSTLTKILVGVEKPDAGSMTFRGLPFAPKDPLDAARNGISIAYQESATVADLKVVQWMYLGRELKGRVGLLKVSEMRRECASLLDELGISCHPDDRIRDLPGVSRKMIEIAKAIDVSRKTTSAAVEAASMVILDEPTSSLTDKERDLMYAKLKEMITKSSFLLISHYVPEVLDNSDRIYVLRDGRNAGVFDTSTEDVKEKAVYVVMFGKEIAEIGGQGTRGLTSQVPETMLKVSGIGYKGSYRGVNLEVRRGEILSLDGAPHSGKLEIAKTIAGIIKQDEGTVEKGGRVLQPSVGARISSGIGYFSGERSDELFLIWPVVRNITITILSSLQSRRFVMPTMDGRKERDAARTMVDRLGIQPPDVETLLRNLSGGNMQKVGLAKWLSRDPDLLVLVNPTAGIDTKTKMEIYQILIGMRDRGKSIVLVSDDVDELYRLSDRIAQVEGGSIRKVITGVAKTE